MLPTMRCDPCGKSFTGEVCFQQHVESEKHKRKILNLGYLKSSNETCPRVQSTETTQQTLDCPVCKIFFNSLSSFQIHSVSPEHAQKVIEKNSNNNKASEVFNNSNHMINYEDNIKNESMHDEASDNILPPSEMMVSHTLTFAKCNICNKIFSGPEPYKQHIESAAHKKKAELEKNGFGKVDQNVQLSCSPCKKSFSGHVPYRQHMESENHKKKILSLKFQEKEASVIDSASGIEESKEGEINQSNPWFCNICQKQCSGYIPYQQHLEGIPHLKNVKANKQNYISKPVNSEQFALQNKTIGKDTLDASCMINGDNTQSNIGNRIDVDYVLPGLEEKFKIMSNEELEKSLKIFLPGEDIDFDKSGNEMDRNSSNEEILPSDEMKENSCVYQSCKTCNVDLKTKEETICHLESFEHYSKKWQ